LKIFSNSWNGVEYSKIPVIHYKAAAKNTFLNVLLTGLIVPHLTPDTKELQRLAESRKSNTLKSNTLYQK
jgi:hypothetical protein